MQGTPIAALKDLRKGQPVKFNFLRAGVRIAAFVVRVQGKVVAYENLCRHLPLELDDNDNRFFTADRKHIVCQLHGALYEPLTGRCLRGPCAGASLKRVAVEVRDNAVWLAESPS